MGTYQVFPTFVFPGPTACKDGNDRQKTQQPVAKQPVATPARNSYIPELNDPLASQPVPGEIRLSHQAMESRMRRVFAPNIQGQFKVSQEIIQMYRSKKGKKTLTQIFQSCGFNTDHGTKKFP